MRLYVVLMISFMFIASLVGVVGYTVGSTGDRILTNVAFLQATSLAETEAAAQMTASLQRSQIAAHQIVAARYRERTDPTAWPVGQPDHEWQPDPETEALIADLEEALVVFRKELSKGREATSGGRVPSPAATALEGAASAETAALLSTLEEAFGAYEIKVDDFIHRGRYHPSDDVSEFLTTDLEVFYRDSLVPALAAYAGDAQASVEQELDLIESAFAAANRRNFALTGAAFAVAMLLGVVIARSISRPLDGLQAGLGRLGKGDLDTRVELRTKTEIAELAGAFNQMAERLQATTVSRSYLDNIIQSMDEMLVVADADGRIEKVNRTALSTLGYEERELIGQPVAVLLGGVHPDDTSPELTGSLAEGDRKFATKSGDAILVSVSSAALGPKAAGATVYLAQDITERKAGERRLQSSLEEKDVLLKEVHHRVKNNLQVISSLLSLQRAETDSGSADRAFRESQNRIRSMALIHEQLYRSEDLAHIRFTEYVQRLVDQVRRSNEDSSNRVKINVDVDDATLRVDTAIPYGMIINELLSNAIEHAFPGQVAGAVTVAFRAGGGHHTLEVRDDGVGLPEGFDPHTSDSLGLRLVRELVAQLGAALHVESGRGTRILVAPDGAGA